MPRLKVCGVKDAAFAAGAAMRGVDYLGFVFAAGSPRLVTPEMAREIAEAVRRAVPAPPRFVGVFVKHSAAEIVGIASLVGLDVIQLHGSYGVEAVAAIKEGGYEVWRLYGEAHEEGGILDAAESAADAVLVDGRRGNESRRADWSLVEPLKRAERRVVLAGGISSANIASAIATGADVIDVNSSIETSPGEKSLALLDDLLAQIAVADCRRILYTVHHVAWKPIKKNT